MTSFYFDSANRWHNKVLSDEVQIGIYALLKWLLENYMVQYMKSIIFIVLYYNFINKNKTKEILISNIKIE